MRGNEIQPQASSSGFGALTIPMRGNELLPHARKLRLVLAYNPHEG